MSSLRRLHFAAMYFKNYPPGVATLKIKFSSSDGAALTVWMSNLKIPPLFNCKFIELFFSEQNIASHVKKLIFFYHGPAAYGCHIISTKKFFSKKPFQRLPFIQKQFIQFFNYAFIEYPQ